ncbi:hypothetical protein ColLi_13257 [Colletotrichum liriopes]|uniref:Uncharacterized protein n=1 Tax=Colletotrichum liriopes TaxID=708192 RepID=A0AA37GZV8_9PEZI|nr:hypothetical protein ColLi_13257 [Colletotrichum liriopes]
MIGQRPSPKEGAEIAKWDELLLKLTKAILLRKPVSTIGRAFQPSKSISIRWELASGGEGSVGDSDADQAALALLVKDCEPATFGRGDEEVFDQGHRKVGKMDTEAFCTDFGPCEYGVMETVVQALANTVDGFGQGQCRDLRAELYKLDISQASVLCS